MKLLAKYSVIFVSLLAFSIVGIGCVADDDSTNNDVWPYDENFYIILNLAVGGGLGGAIDPNLSNATMEVDYVRWYQ